MEEYPEKSVTVWAAGEPPVRETYLHGCVEAPGREGKLCAVGISRNKACLGTYGTGQQHSGTEASLGGGMGAKGPSNLRRSSSSEGKGDHSCVLFSP